MKNRISFLFPLLAIFLISTINCTGNKKGVIDISEIVLNAESLAGENVIVEGLCTHVCEKSGMKLFLKDDGSEQTIRFESNSTLGKFNPDCVGKHVRVRGIVVKDKPMTDVTQLHHTDSCEIENSQFLFHIAAEHYQIIEGEKL